MNKKKAIEQLTVDPKSNIPLHKQVEELIRELISQKEAVMRIDPASLDTFENFRHLKEYHSTSH